MRINIQLRVAELKKSNSCCVASHFFHFTLWSSILFGISWRQLDHHFSTTSYLFRVRFLSTARMNFYVAMQCSIKMAWHYRWLLPTVNSPTFTLSVGVAFIAVFTNALSVNAQLRFAIAFVTTRINYICHFMTQQRSDWIKLLRFKEKKKLQYISLQLTSVAFVAVSMISMFTDALSGRQTNCFLVTDTWIRTAWSDWEAGNSVSEKAL